MSTRSTIGILREDGSVDGVYCHFDGYVSYNGKILYLYYRETEKIEQLIALGSLSLLGAFCDCPEGHTFDDQQRGYTVAYHRDRGEELSIDKFDSKEEMADRQWNGSEYFYLWNGSEWLVSGRNGAWSLLEDRILELAKEEGI